MKKRFDPSPHLARQQCCPRVVIVVDCPFYDPIVAGQEHHADPLFRQLAKRSMDGPFKLIKHRHCLSPQLSLDGRV
jgi:hypothetical protein